MRPKLKISYPKATDYDGYDVKVSNGVSCFFLGCIEKRDQNFWELCYYKHGIRHLVHSYTHLRNAREAVEASLYYLIFANQGELLWRTQSPVHGRTESR